VVSVQPEALKERGEAVLEVVNFARAEAQQRVTDADEFAMYDDLVGQDSFGPYNF
jgi:hypothetical protein